MAARQLILEPTEANTELDSGSERAHPNSADKGSMQVRLRARASAWGTTWPGPAHNLALLALALANGQSCPLVESEVEHEVNKPRRDEPAACTVANISLTTG
eukprot:scaffold12388_cov122-Isochrysis_galbana.AAC.11